MYGPVLEGKLFRLRPPRPEEAELMITWFEDLEVTRFLNLTFPPSLEAEKEWLAKTGTDPNVIWWIIEHEGRAVGGTGIAREMMQVRAAYAFTHTPLRKLRSTYIEGNEASARAQKAAGYSEVGRLREESFGDGRWRDIIVTELMRQDWEKAKSV
jgi:ribosomal-protein-alanine N-acetyltransferase